MRSSITFGKLLHVPETETRVGEGESRHRFLEAEGQGVAIVVSRLNLDTKSTQSLEIAVKASHINPQFSQDVLPREGAMTE
jgi:hypothetical protein